MSSNVYRNAGVLAIQKTWLHQQYDDNLVALNGYKVFRQDRHSSKKKHGGGVATFINTSWSTSNHVCFNYSNDSIDCVIVKCRPKHLSKYLYVYITNIYITPDCSLSNISIFADEFTEFAAHLFKNS